MYGTYCRLGVNIHALDTTVVRAARQKIAAKHRNSPDKREARKKFYREMLEHHHHDRDLYRQFGL